MDSWLLIRGLKTLHLRLKQHDANAKKIAAYLEPEELVTDVLYTGKGGMLSFRVKRRMGDPFLSNMKLITFAESLGGVESFITYPATQTHADMPYEERVERGVCDRLLRFSVGIEEAEDLIADLQQVFDTLTKEVNLMTKHIETALIHAGVREGYANKKGAVNVPMYLSSTFHQETIDEFGEYDYARSGNPTRDALEKAVAELEGGVRAHAFASGIAAVSA